MPNVKAPQVPTNVPGRIPDVNVQYDIGGTTPMSGIAKGLEQAAPTLAKAFADQKAKADDDAVLSAHNQLIAWQQKNIRASRDENPNAALNQTGEKAVNIAPLTRDAHADFAQKLEESLANEDQKSKFRAIASRETEGVFNELNGFERKQYEITSEVKFNTSIDELVDKAWKSYRPETGYNQKTFEDSIATGEVIILQRAKKYNWPKEELAAKIKEFTSRAYVGLISSMQEESPGTALQMFEQGRRDNRLDFTKDGVKELERSLRATGFVYQAQNFLLGWQKAKMTPEQQLVEVQKLEQSERPPPVEVTEHLKKRIQADQATEERIKDARSKTIYEAGRNYVNRNFKTWTKDTSTHYQQLTQRGSEYASHLDDYARSLNRASSSDAAERRYQKNVDDLYVARVRRAVASGDEQAVSSLLHDDPGFQDRMTRDSRSGKSVGLPTDKAVEVAKEFADKYAKHQDATSRVRRDAFRRQMLDIAKDFTYYTTTEDKSRFVSQVMIMYDDWREQHDWKNPTEEDIAQLKSTATLLVQTDPEAFLFKGEMTVPEAISAGSYDGAKPSPKKDQESPRHRDFTPPNLVPGSTPGRVKVKNKTTGAMFFLKQGVNSDEWLKKNGSDWEVIP